MAWFTCMAGVGGKGNSVIVTCDADFAGIPITCTNGQKTYTKVCPSFSPYEVTFTGLVAGTWTISATVDGVVYSTTAIVTDITAVLSYGFNWKMWVDSSSSLHSSDYTDLADLLSDEAAIRQLFTEHAPTDYAASTATVTPDLATVLNNDICAKWINLSDYALDTLYANPLIAAEMDNADKYFYGEWGIVDDTTTPPTWGAKGNVPVMTSNSAPYGTASANSEYDSTTAAWKAFDGDEATNWNTRVETNATLTYKFTNPICPKRVKIRPSYNVSGRVKNFKIQGSNDGTTFEDLTETLQCTNTSDNQYFDIDTDNYYLYLRIAVADAWGAYYIGIITAQFYGRELSVSVPKMDTNTTPYGEAISSGANSGYEAFKAFDNNASTQFVSPSVTDSFVAYKFNKPIKLRAFSYVQWGYDTSKSWYGINTYKIVGKNGSGLWEDITETLTATRDTNTHVLSVNSEDTYDTIGLFILDSTNTSAVTCGVSSVQFYGLDYSEKEFEQGATKKWLYDHGVELEELTAYPSYTNYSIGTYTKNNDNIQLNVSGSSNGIALSVQLDCSAYDYLMCKGRKLTNNANNNKLATASTGYLRASTIGSNTIDYTNPKNSIIALDVQSVSQQVYCGVFLETSNTIDATSSMFEELWLE